MAILKSKLTTYEFSLDEIKALIANDLELPVEVISVEFVQQDMSNERFDTHPNYQVTKLRVNVDETKTKGQKNKFG